MSHDEMDKDRWYVTQWILNYAGINKAKEALSRPLKWLHIESMKNEIFLWEASDELIM